MKEDDRIVDGPSDPRRLTGAMRIVSHHPSGEVSGDHHSKNAHISPCGRYAVFQSKATNLISGLTLDPDIWRVYLYDLCTAQVELISVDDNGDELSGDSTNPSISEFGRFVSFENDGGTVSQVFLRDRGPQPWGDLNGDGVVDETDEDILLFNWGACACCAADLDGNGTVGVSDLLILLGNWGDNSCNWVLTGED